MLTVAKLIGEAGDIARFRSADAFAMLAGVAPIPASSGQTQRMRLNRGGNRQLNRALYVIALIQAWHHAPAQAYVARKRAEAIGAELGKKHPNQATILQLTRVNYRRLMAERDRFADLGVSLLRPTK